MILQEFDKNVAKIEPTFNHKKIENFPETLIAVFSYNIFNELLNRFSPKIIASFEDVDAKWNIYSLEYKNKQFAFFKARYGAPASVASFERIIAMGAKRIVVCGSCGVLDPKIQECNIIIPTHAIRAEGTSYHYAIANDVIDVDKKYIDVFKEVCRENNYSYILGGVLTTDSFYRETQRKIETAIKMGAICVDMECAALQALCDFRKVEFFQFFFTSDNLGSKTWNPRSLDGNLLLDKKTQISLLAFELASRIE